MCVCVSVCTNNTIFTYIYNIHGLACVDTDTQTHTYTCYRYTNMSKHMCTKINTERETGLLMQMYAHMIPNHRTLSESE